MSDLCGMSQIEEEGFKSENMQCLISVVCGREPAWDSGLGEKASRLPSLVCFFPTKLNAFKEHTLLFQGGYVHTCYVVNRNFLNTCIKPKIGSKHTIPKCNFSTSKPHAQHVY